MFLALLITIPAMLYLFMGGVCGRSFYQNRITACRRQDTYGYCIHEHMVAAIFFGAGWPVTLLIVAGIAATTLPETLAKRAEGRKKQITLKLEEARKAELAELDHQNKVQQKRNQLLKSQLPEGADLGALLRDASV